MGCSTLLALSPVAFTIVGVFMGLIMRGPSPLGEDAEKHKEERGDNLP